MAFYGWHAAAAPGRLVDEMAARRVVPLLGLEELPGRRTRLVVSGSGPFGQRWLQAVTSVTLLEPSHRVMQTRQFANLRRHAERGERAL